MMYRHPPILCASRLYAGDIFGDGGVQIRDWKEGDGRFIMDLLLSVESGRFNPEGPLEVDCGSEESIKESYSEDGGCMLIAETDSKLSGGIVGTAALIVGTPVTYLKSGASLSSPKPTGAIRRVVCSVSDGDDAERLESCILQNLLIRIESRAVDAGVGELIVLAYPATTRQRPNAALLEKNGYTKLPVNLDGVDVVQYGKMLNGSNGQVTRKNEEVTLKSRNNSQLRDATIVASLIGFITLALFSVGTFMGLELMPSSDNRGIGSPLSVQELAIMRQEEKLQRTDLDGGQVSYEGGRQWKDLSFEERQEEGALMKIIQGQNSRIK